GASYGDAGAYEELKGTLRFAVDPKHEANERMTDLAMAPRTHAGRVEFAADVSILLPVDRARCSGRVMLDVVNRGNTVAVPNFNRATRPVFRPGADADPPVDVGDGFLLRRGFVVISCGWQCDLPAVPGLLGLRAPEAIDLQGGRLTGRVYTQLQSPEDVSCMMLSDRGHRASPAADLDDRDAILTMRDQPDGPALTIPRGRWRFARVASGELVADPHYVRYDGGLEKGRLYQIVDTAVGAPVLGLGLAPSTPEDLQRRLAPRRSPLSVFYTNSSAEYHRGDASLVHTDPEGMRDVPSGPSARVYHFAGTEHGLGVWPPTDRRVAAADPS